MRKIGIGGLAGLMALLILFSGCQSGSQTVKLDKKNPVSLEIWHYYNGPQKNAFDALVTAFNDTVGAEQGIIVEAFSQGNVEELIQKVLDAVDKKVGAKEPPDMFAAYADTAYQVDRMGMVADLSPYLTKEELDDYVDTYIDEGRLNGDGQLKIFPTAKSTELLMLNKTDWDTFAAATGASREELRTMEGLVRVAKQYYEWTDGKTETPNDGKAFFGRDAMANYFIVGGKQLGVDIFSVENGKVTFRLDEAVMRKLWDNYYLPFISGYFAANGRFRSDDAKTGDIIALVGSTSGAAYFPDKVTVNDTESYPIQAEFMPAPIFEGGDKIAVQQGAGMVVTKADKKKEYAAVVFLKWFTEAARNIDFSIGSGYLPVRKDAQDLTLIRQALDKEGTQKINTNLKLSLPAAISMTKEFTFYTNKAFKGGTNARAVLEDSLQNKAAADRKTVVQALEGGTSLAQAVAALNTDRNFQAWMEELRGQLDATVA